MKGKFQILLLIVFVLGISNFVIADSPVKHNNNNPQSNIIADSSYATVANTQSPMAVQGGGNDVFASQSVASIGIGVLNRFFLTGIKYKGEGYSGNFIPSINVSYEYGLSPNWGIGAMFNFSTIKLAASGTIDNSKAIYPHDIGQDYSFSSTYKITGLSYMLVGAYHIPVSDNVDPFVGITVGYNTISSSSTTNDPNIAYDNKSVPMPKSGIEYGAVAGMRYYFNEHFGVWGEVSSALTTGSIINLGATVKF